MSAAPGQAHVPGPPYPPTGAGLGGQPTRSLDIPVSAVILGLFVVGAALNMTIFQLNRRRSHKFILSALLFGFCMARIVANSLRIAWASHPRNASLAIAAGVMLNAGVLLLFIINLIFAQRILRAYHPVIGWSAPVRVAFRALFVSVVACLIMVIVALVYSFFTLDLHVRSQILSIQRTGVTYFAVLAFLPIPIVALSLALPRKAPMDKFGEGRMRTKVGLLVFTSALLSLGAGFRAGVVLSAPRPASNPAWYHSKACFYVFNYTIELIVVFTYALSRFDRRFHIPNGSSAPGHYSNNPPPNKSDVVLSRLNTEEEVFGDDARPPTEELQSERAPFWSKSRSQQGQQAV